MVPGPPRLLLLFGLLLAGAGALPAAAQEPEASEPGAGEGWNSPAVLALVARAVDRRYAPLLDSLLTSYHARAEGHIHFLADRRDGSPPIPLRVDQVALDLYWRTPGLTRQVIRGMRKEDLLPIRRFNYYQDRLTVIQNGFGDEIQVGQGMDVRNVPHPLARYVGGYYDYALGDSLTLTLPGAAAPVRVVEVRVRPRHTDQPSFVGSVFLDAASASITSLEFTFTPASYVDRRLDHVRISLEHALWEGRYWLPFRQRVEVRREIPELDFSVGSVIQGVLQVGEYDFDPDLPVEAFLGPRVVLRSDDPTDPSHFSRDLFAEFEAQGLRRVDLATVEAEARRMVRQQYMSGLPRLRLHLDGASSAFRVNRAEGVFLGGGISRTLGGEGHLGVLGGWAVGGERGSLAVRARFRQASPLRVTAEGYLGRLQDAGQERVDDGVLNSLGALFLGVDHLDPFLTRGGLLRLERTLERGATFRMEMGGEVHSAASPAWTEGPLGSPEPYRPLPRVEEGTLFRVAGEVAGVVGIPRLPGARGRLGVEAGAWEGDGFLRATGGTGLRLQSPDLSRRGLIRLDGGWIHGVLPPQEHFLLGGRGTLPGHDFRGWRGDRYFLLRGEGEQELVRGWLGLRLLAGLGGVWGPGEEGSGGLQPSVGVGVGVVRGILRLDYGWGLRGGGGELSLSVDPAFRPWL